MFIVEWPDVCKRFPVNKEGTWMQKVYDSIMCA